MARSFAATLVVLITVVMSMTLIRTLGLAVNGRVNPQDVVLLMGYSILGNLSIIMTLSLFIAVTNTLARMYRESEMAVWFSSGVGLAHFIKPIVRFAWPIWLAIAALMLIVRPWAEQKTIDLRLQYEQRGDLDRVALGQFQENASGSRVFFVEALGSRADDADRPALAPPPDSGDTLKETGRSAKNVFISERVGDAQVITTAHSGQVQQTESEQRIILKNGQRTQQSEKTGEVKIIDFEEYAIIANTKAIDRAAQQPAKSLSTPKLLDKPSPAHFAEIGWRLGMIWAAINLALLATLVSATNPRAGRGYGIALALLCFFAYYNLLSLGYARVANGQWSFSAWLFGLHASVMLVIIVWITVQHHQWSWRQLFAPRHNLPAA